MNDKKEMTVNRIMKILICFFTLLFSVSALGQKTVTIDVAAKSFDFKSGYSFENKLESELLALKTVTVDENPLIKIEAVILREGFDSVITLSAGEEIGRPRPSNFDPKDEDFIFSLSISKRETCTDAKTRKSTPCYVVMHQILMISTAENLDENYRIVADYINKKIIKPLVK